MTLYDSFAIKVGKKSSPDNVIANIGAMDRKQHNGKRRNIFEEMLLKCTRVGNFNIWH